MLSSSSSDCYSVDGSCSFVDRVPFRVRGRATVDRDRSCCGAWTDVYRLFSDLVLVYYDASAVPQPMYFLFSISCYTLFVLYVACLTSRMELPANNFRGGRSPKLSHSYHLHVPCGGGYSPSGKLTPHSCVHCTHPYGCYQPLRSRRSLVSAKSMFAERF